MLQWTSGADGNWDAVPNWSYGLRPGAADQDDVLIRPANGLTVTGSVSPTTIQSLTIGAQTASTATLNIQESGPVTVTDMVTIESRGRIAGSGILATDHSQASLGLSPRKYQLEWLADYEHAGRVELLVGVRGDMDFDGDVDFDDIDDFVLGLNDPTEFLLTFGHAASAAGDGDGDADLDFDDIEGFVGRLIGGAPIGTSGDPLAAPEPPTLLLLGLGALSVIVFSQQRSRTNDAQHGTRR